MKKTINSFDLDQGEEESERGRENILTWNLRNVRGGLVFRTPEMKPCLRPLSRPRRVNRILIIIDSWGLKDGKDPGDDLIVVALRAD